MSPQFWPDDTQTPTGPLERLRAPLAEQIAALSAQHVVPGYLLGIAQGANRLVLAHGVANLNTGAPMTHDTAYLLGSITKIMTTTLLLRCVERGLVDLDQPATRYLPEFRLSPHGAADKILVRQLVDHTNGIDADLLMPPTGTGDADVATYMQAMRKCGVLFPPGTFMHYSNPGMTVAGRIVEVLTGKSFNAVLESEIFAPLGMQRSCTSPKQAILHRTAVGSQIDPSSGTARATEMFMLPESGAAAGATAIVTIDDLLVFGQTMLARGMAPNGTRILAASLANRMTQTSFDLQTVNVPPTGLGWMLSPIAGTTAWWHGGGSPGGASTLVVLPEQDLVIANFGNSTASIALHDAVIKTVLEDYLGRRLDLPFQPATTTLDAKRYVGSYASHQMEQQITATADGLSVSKKFVPMDEPHADFFRRYGSSALTGAVELVPITPTLFAPKGAPLESMAGLWGRFALTSFHQSRPDGRFQFSHAATRAMPRVD